MQIILDAAATFNALPYPALLAELQSTLRDPTVTVPARLIQPLHGGGSLFVMPASDARIAIAKLITFTPANAQHGVPTIQGDVVVFDLVSGKRIAILDGPAVTARRTAAVSLLAALRLARRTDGPLLIVGAGAQGRAHLDAFHAGLPLQEVWIASRSVINADALVRHAQQLGLRAQRIDDPNAALAHCPLVVSTTPAHEVVLHAMPRADAFIAAVGAFTPQMVEWDAAVCRAMAVVGTIVVDSRAADHEAGDLLQAGIDVGSLPTLADVIDDPRWRDHPARRTSGPVFFKSCGWAGWDLAAARCITSVVGTEDGVNAVDRC